MLKVLLVVLVWAVVTNAAPSFDPGANVGEKHKALVTSLTQTLQWLKAFGEETSQGWQEFLEVGPLAGELQKENPSIVRLKEILNKWRKNNSGLEDPKFVQTQRALRDFIRALEIYHQGDLEKATARRVSELEKLVTRGEREDAEKIGQLLGWLEITKQAPEKVKAIRAQWAQPNLHVQISSRLIAYGLEGTKIEQSQHAGATIVGVYTSGISHMKGTVTAKPVASGRNGVGIVELTLNATVDSPHNYGRKGPAGIHSTSHSDAVITKRLIFAQDGITTERARYSVCTNSQVTQIDAGPIVSFFAWRKAGKKQGQANCEAAHITGQKLAAELDKQVDAQLKKAKEEQTAKIKKTLESEGTYPSSLAFATNTAGILMSAKEANRFQLGAPGTPPAFKPENDINAAVHESFVGNFLESYLGNKVEHDWSWYNITKLVSMEDPPALRVHDRAPRWYLRVAEWSPMVGRFEGGLLHFRINGTEISWQKDQQQLKVARPVQVRVTYQPAIEDGKPLGLRQGDVEVEYVDGSPNTDVAVRLQAMLHEKMSAFFPERYELGGLTIPKGSGWEKFDKLKAQEIRTENGWLVTGYKLEP